MFWKILSKLTKPIQKLVKNPPRFVYKVEKRFRFVISVSILSSFMLVSTFFFFDWSWVFVPLFILASYILVFYSILEGVEKAEWLTLFVMPVFFYRSLLSVLLSFSCPVAYENSLCSNLRHIFLRPASYLKYF